MSTTIKLQLIEEIEQELDGLLGTGSQPQYDNCQVTIVRIADKIRQVKNWLQADHQKEWEDVVDRLASEFPWDSQSQ